MVLSAENLKALSHFCLCSAEELQWKPLHPDAVKFKLKTNYSATFCPLLRLCSCKGTLNLQQGAHVQQGTECQQPPEESLAEQVGTKWEVWESLWGCRPFLMRKAPPLQSITHLSEGVQNCAFSQRLSKKTLSLHYNMNSIPNFAVVCGGVFPHSPSIVVYRQHVWGDARSGTV